MPTTRIRRQRLPSPSIPQTTMTRPNPKQNPTSAKEALPTRDCTNHKATKSARRIPTIEYTCGRVRIYQGRGFTLGQKKHGQRLDNADPWKGTQFAAKAKGLRTVCSSVTGLKFGSSKNTRLPDTFPSWRRNSRMP